MRGVHQKWVYLPLLLFLLTTQGCWRGHTVFDGPLSEHPDNDIFRFSDAGLFDAKGRDAVRILITPSFGIYRYRFDFFPMTPHCRVLERGGRYTESPKYPVCGDVLVEAERKMTDAYSQARFAEPSKRFKFVIPAGEFTEFFNVLKRKMNGWNGSTVGMTDGTSTAVELHDGNKVSSYHSNLSLEVEPDDPSAYAAQTTRTIALAFGPANMFPLDSSWTARSPDGKIQPKYLCSVVGLNVPDSDGWGIGNDTCARYLQKIEATN